MTATLVHSSNMFHLPIHPQKPFYYCIRHKKFRFIPSFTTFCIVQVIFFRWEIIFCKELLDNTKHEPLPIRLWIIFNSIITHRHRYRNSSAFLIFAWHKNNFLSKFSTIHPFSFSQHNIWYVSIYLILNLNVYSEC